MISVGGLARQNNQHGLLGDDNFEVYELRIDQAEFLRKLHGPVEIPEPSARWTHQTLRSATAFQPV